MKLIKYTKTFINKKPKYRLLFKFENGEYKAITSADFFFDDNLDIFDKVKDLIIGRNYEIRYSLFFKNKIIEFKEVLWL